MEKFNRSEINRFYLLGFIIPPLAWIILGMYIGIYSFKSIFEMSFALPVIYVGSLVGIYFYINKLLDEIELAIKKSGKKNIYIAQRAIVYLPKFYLITLPIFSLILPLSAQSSLYTLLTFEFFMEWIFSACIMYITSTIFFISMLNSLEKSVHNIPVSGSFNNLNLDLKFTLITIPNNIALFFVIISVYILIFLRNDQNPDVVYVLLMKSILFAVYILGIFTYNHLLLRNQLVNPVKELNEFMNKIISSGGNMNVKLQFSNRDEYSDIAANFNRLLDFIKQIIKQIDVTAEDVLNSSKRLSQTTKKLGYASQKEHGTIGEIIKFNQQIKDINQEMREISGKNENEITNIKKSFHEINEETRDGIHRLDDLTEKVRLTATNAQVGEKSLIDMRHTMESLVNLFLDIREVMSTMYEIAEKINLLSLNASIEAARAGEFGLGFTVVAQQIAHLSSETNKHANSIDILLEKSDDKIRSGTEQILKGVQTIVHLLNGVEDIEKVFGKIVFTLKDGISKYNSLESGVGGVETLAKSSITHMGVQGERIQLLAEALDLTQELIVSSIDSVRELSTNAEHSLHFAHDLQKKVTQFQINISDTAAAENKPVLKNETRLVSDGNKTS